MELDLTEAIEAAAIELWGKVVPDVRLADVRQTAEAAVRAAAPIIERVAREQIADQLFAYSANYPEDVFPASSDVRDAIAGTAMRHAYVYASRMAREETW